VTVLFADVVHSMDIASAVGAERLREIMAELLDRSSAVVKRYGGTVDKFTGDGIMAVFGAPLALEDHALRACLAALGVQQEAKRLAVEVRERDGADLQLRVGLNSGQVIAGEIGSGPFGYTAVGEQVGMAKRMESVAPPGGVMLTASTARLVGGAATLGESELVRIKGADGPVPARRLLGIGEQHRGVDRAESKLVGRRWEMSAVEGLLDRAIAGHGSIVGVVGPPGIGKSRLVREVAGIAGRRGVEVFTTYCESHTSQVPFHAVARLLRAATGVDALDGQAARDRVRDRIADADPEDLALFDDLLGIADPNTALPPIDPDARRRRLTALVNAASLARETPAVFVVEDAHWIDEVSESMITDFLTVIPQTPSLMLVSYRPEYEGALARVNGAQTIALAPLSDSETAALVADLLGPDPSVGELATMIAKRAAGNPFFAEEIVRDLAERGVLRGNRSAYESTADVGEVSVPATLQATIAARIDRLAPAAKRTLSAAAVIGSRFSRELLETLGIEPILEDLVVAELVDQITFTRDPVAKRHILVDASPTFNQNIDSSVINSVHGRRGGDHPWHCVDVGMEQAEHLVSGCQRAQGLLVPCPSGRAGPDNLGCDSRHAGCSSRRTFAGRGTHSGCRGRRVGRSRHCRTACNQPQARPRLDPGTIGLGGVEGGDFPIHGGRSAVPGH
jgi:class 3 adenylate cyclase